MSNYATEPVGGMPRSSFRDRVRAGEELLGAWSFIGSPVIARLAAASGVDYVVCDLQHGSATEDALPALAGAIVAGGAVPVVRTRSAAEPDIGRALDLGAEAVIVPSTRGLAEARSAVAATRLGPVGTRSAGQLTGGSPDPCCVLIIETEQALRDLREIVRIEGLDAVYVGTLDLALSLGRGTLDHPDPLEAELAEIAEVCRDAGMAFGIHAASAASALRHRSLGATLVTVASDLAALGDGLRAEVGHALAARR